MEKQKLSSSDAIHIYSGVYLYSMYVFRVNLCLIQFHVNITCSSHEYLISRVNFVLKSLLVGESELFP